MPDVNLIPKEYKKRKQKLSVTFSKTGGVVLGLLILGLLLYGGLLLYQNEINKELDNIKTETQILDQKRDKEREKVVIDLDKKLGVLKEIFEKHVYWSKLFNKMEELTVFWTYFSEVKFNFSGEAAKASLFGNALTYTTLAKQMKSFQENSQVESVEVSNISLSTEGGIDFDLAVIFSKDILLNHD